MRDRGHLKWSISTYKKFLIFQVKLEVRLEGVVTVPPVPETMLQAPVPAPAAGAFAARAIDVAPQVDVRSVPAFDVVGLRLKIINTSLVDVHGLLDMVHLNV
jgi:hypothetical protein